MLSQSSGNRSRSHCNLVVDRNWQGDCQDNDQAQKDRRCATQPPRKERPSPDYEQLQDGQDEADRIPEWHEAPESPCKWLGHANVRFVADRIQHRMDEQRHGPFVSHQHTRREKTQEHDHDLHIPSRQSYSLTRVWMPTGTVTTRITLSGGINSGWSPIRKER